MPVSFRSTSDVIIRVSNLEQAVSFYQSALAFVISHRTPGLVGFDTGAFTLYVEQGELPHGPIFEMMVSDLDAAKKRLTAAGCSIIEEDPAVPRCYLRDPHGLIVNIGEISPDARGNPRPQD